MATYAIGDVQGCLAPLQQLLKKIQFSSADTLWFVGDLVNRGPQSLETLIFIKELSDKGQAKVVLGNHDLHLLAVYYGIREPFADDTIQPILNSPHVEELVDWLRQQVLAHYDPQLNYLMVHAGVAPNWSVADTLNYAHEVEVVLQSNDIKDFLKQMYGNDPDHFSEDLIGFARLRVITNILTRMRFCDAQGRLNLSAKGTLESCPPGFYPWFKVPKRKTQGQNIVFGHWSALQGETHEPHTFALDTGCVWGGALTAMRLNDREIFQSY